MNMKLMKNGMMNFMNNVMEEKEKRVKRVELMVVWIGELIEEKRIGGIENGILRIGKVI